MKGNEYEEQHQKQSCFMPSMGPSIIDFNNAQPQPQQPQQSTNENSNEKYVNPQAIIVMERPLLCTSRPGWKGPCAGDTERCAGCGTKYGLLRRSQFCPCCMRAYCNSCMTHKAVVPGQRGRGGAERAAVCDACYSHLSREDMRCVPRLVPYISEKNPSIRLEALRELLELLQTTADNDIPRTEFLACSTISTLRGIFASTNSNSGGSGDGSGSGSGSGSGGNRSVDRSEVECAASILARLLAFGPSSSDRVLEEKGYVASIVDAAERDGERAPGLAAVIAGLAGTVPGRRALLETRRVYRALSKALAGGSPAVVPNCVHALRALASGKEDKPGRNPEAESEILILSSLSAILAGSQQQPAEVAVSLRSDALSAADKLCYTKETKMFLCQSDGVSNVLHALAQPLLPPSTAADIRHGASILYKFAAIDECAPTVAKAAGEIVTLAAAAQDDPETQGGLLQVVGKLARNPATKAPVAALTVARAADFAAVFASLNPIVETAGLRIILAALEADPAHAQAAFAATDIPATLRRIVAARSPEAQKAFKALALIDRKKKQ